MTPALALAPKYFDDFFRFRMIGDLRFKRNYLSYTSPPAQKSEKILLPPTSLSTFFRLDILIIQRLGGVNN